MRKSAYAAATALAIVMVAGQANAVVVYGPSAQADASTLVHQGPNVAGSTINIRNGQETYRNVGPGGTASGGGSATLSEASVYIPGGSGDRSFTSTGYGFSDLSTGTLKASVATTGGEFFGGPGGYIDTRFADTIYFNNTTDGDLSLSLSWSFDGTMTTSGPNVSSTGYSQLSLASCASCGDVRFAMDGRAANDNATAFFTDQDGIYRVATFGADTPLYGAGPHWVTAPNGFGGAIISTTLLIPVGLSSLGISAALVVDCRGGNTCDYGNTGTFRFGQFADGLSFTSESGKFLSNVAAPNPGAVPEPATWAMMILGFGAAGSVLRRRRAAAT